MKTMIRKALACVGFGLAGVGQCIAYDDTVEREFAFSGERALRIEMEDADISYVGEDRDTVSIVVERSIKGVTDAEAKRLLEERVELEFESSDDGVRLRGSERFGRKGVRFRQTVTARGPVDVSLWVKLEDGNMDLRSMEGSARIKVEDGDIEATGLAGATEIRLEDGNMNLAGVRGSLTVSLEDGNIDVGFSEVLGGASRIRVEDGNVALRVPAELAADLSLSVNDGKFEVGEIGEAALRESSGKRQVFALNGGGELIEVKVEDGNVRVN